MPLFVAEAAAVNTTKLTIPAANGIPINLKLLRTTVCTNFIPWNHDDQ